MVIENMQKFRLLGKIVGKAVFDRIPINLAFCRPLLKTILNEKIILEDVKFYDSQVSFYLEI
jgi:E3 ubiquitin-protein ligase HUWE1